VFAFTSSESKGKEANGFGTHQIVNSTKAADITKVKGLLDFVLVTANVPLN